MIGKINIILFVSLIISSIALAQGPANDDRPVLKFYAKNMAGSTVHLVAFVGTKTEEIDSALIKSNNDTLILKGLVTDEEQRYQFSVDKKFTLHPILATGQTTEVSFDAADVGKVEGMYIAHYINSQSSVDWNNAMFYPVRWKRPRNLLQQSLKNIDQLEEKLAVQKKIDSLNDLTEAYYVNLLYITKSIATIQTTMRLLKGENNGKPYTELLTDIAARFPNSIKVNDAIEWFNKYKYIEEPKPSVLLANGTVAPNFEFITLEGLRKQLNSYKGNYVLLDFWASWCAPCRAEAPNLKKAFQQFKDKKVLIIQVSIDRPSDLDKWKKAISNDGVGAFVHTNKSPNDPLIKQFQITSIPANYLIGPDGKIITSNLRGDDLIIQLRNYFNSVQK